MAQQTAVEWLINYCERENWSLPYDIEEIAKAMEKKQIIDAYTWMKLNDTQENSEKYFGYTNEDMLNEYYSKIYKNNIT